MTYTFTWGGVTYTVDDVQRTITFQVPNESIKTVYRVSTVVVNSERKNITVKDVVRYKVDPASNSTIEGTVFKLSERSYSNTTKNSQGVGYWDFFYNLSGTFGTIVERAMINNQLENMQDIFGQGETPVIFNPYNNWNFFYPIHLTLSATEESAVDAADATITATVNNPVGGHDYQYSIDNGATWVGTGNSHTFSDLADGDYAIQVRSTVDQVPKAKTITVSTTISA